MTSCAFFFISLRRCKQFSINKKRIKFFFLLMWYLPGWRLLCGSGGKAQGLKRVKEPWGHRVGHGVMAGNGAYSMGESSG